MYTLNEYSGSSTSFTDSTWCIVLISTKKKKKKKDNFDFKSTYYGSECSGQGNNYIIYTQQRHLKGRKQTFTANEWLNIIKIV